MKRLAFGVFTAVSLLLGAAFAQAPVSVYAVYATAIEEPLVGTRVQW